MYLLKQQLAVELKNKKSIEMIRKTNLHSSSLLGFFMPPNPREMYLSIVCIYYFLYYKDPNFIPRLSKAWEARSYRKTKKKNTKRHTESKNNDNVITNEITNIRVNKMVGDVITTEKELKREKAQEIINEINRNPPPQSEKKDDDNPLLDSDANPWFG